MTPRPAAAAGVVYFLIVFAAGFALGVLRVLALEPALGERAAQLLELPVMAGLSLLTAYRLTRRWPGLDALRPALICGAAALGLVLMGEIAVALWVRNEDLVAGLAARDPVAGLAYLAALILFAAAPAIMRPR